MKRWLRRLRGALGTGLSWAVGWFGVGAIVGVPLAISAGVPVLAGAVSIAFGWARLGFVGGVFFSSVLMVAERRRALDELSLRRFAGWGALGGLLLAGVGITSQGFTLIALIPATVAALLGAASATGSLVLAKRAGDAGLLEPANRSPEIGSGGD